MGDTAERSTMCAYAWEEISMKTIIMPEDTTPKATHTLHHPQTRLLPTPTESVTSSKLCQKNEAKGGPRRGGDSYRTWWCCNCYYQNKTGRPVCSNPDALECRDKYTRDGQLKRPKQDQFLNHRRCKECTPPWDCDWGEGHNRWWNEDMSDREKERLQDKAQEMFLKVSNDHTSEWFKKMEKGRKPLRVTRDSITSMKIEETNIEGSLDRAIQKRIDERINDESKARVKRRKAEETDGCTLS
jgi:hypothetical protein